MGTQAQTVTMIQLLCQVMFGCVQTQKILR